MTRWGGGTVLWLNSSKDVTKDYYQ
jgi:hypothetical protein